MVSKSVIMLLKNYSIFLLIVYIVVRPISTTNIVVFIADDLGYGDVGFLGNNTIRTPNIDKLASDGAILEHHLAPASVCTPSRAALLTGRHPIRMGMLTHNIFRVNIFVSSVSGIPKNETTIAKSLKQQGYNTAIIGKWHLGLNCGSRNDFCHHPLNHGFDRFYGIPLTNLQDFGDEGLAVFTSRLKFLPHSYVLILIITAFTSIYLYRKNIWSLISALTFCLIIGGLIYVISHYYTHLKKFNSIVMRDFEVVEQPIHLDSLTPRLVQEGKEFITDSVKEKKPFFLIMSWVQVHTALHNIRSFRGKSRHGRYGDNIEEMDWSTGEILNTLEEFGLANDTFVYFTSDNGGHLEERGVNGEVEGGWNGKFKGSKTQGAAEGGIRVPTAIRWPKKIARGTRVKQVTGLMDVAPTIAAITDAKLPQDRVIDGKNLMPLLTKETVEPVHELMLHYCGISIHAARYSGDGGIWKLYYYRTKWGPQSHECIHFVCDCFSDRDMIKLDVPQLYNIEEDPYEDRLLDIEEEKYADIVKKINKGVAEHRSSIEPSPSQFNILRILPRPWLQPCCNFPFCTCKDQKYAGKNLELL
ncbi:DgyrCDS2970 [Dimorphilus gyrociliatus]|uniref:DgyrCDS2970 n=1 Tax=Dimorphilus gyrociliatus TaxID=2664684 RepID=A0A7I8VBT2_9ANNE|nr:DgyrCDS2970 [Dimorphilus gyrociliatus]